MSIADVDEQSTAHGFSEGKPLSSQLTFDSTQLLVWFLSFSTDSAISTIQQLGGSGGGTRLDKPGGSHKNSVSPH